MEKIKECDKSQIQVTKGTKENLNKNKEHPRETYEDVIRRLLKLPILVKNYG